MPKVTTKHRHKAHKSSRNLRENSSLQKSTFRPSPAEAKTESKELFASQVLVFLWLATPPCEIHFFSSDKAHQKSSMHQHHGLCLFVLSSKKISSSVSSPLQYSQYSVSMAPLSCPVADSWWSLMSTVPTPGWSTVRRKCSTAKASAFKRSHSCSICSSNCAKDDATTVKLQAGCLCRLLFVGDSKKVGEFWISIKSGTSLL